MDAEHMAAEIRRLRCMVAVVGLGLIALVVLGAGGEGDKDARTLTVERINVVEPDGRLAMVIANSAQLPGAIVGGKETLEPRQAAGMLFFNHTGDECGGLIYRTMQLEDGRGVGYVHLSFDQYAQNQVIKLQSQQNIHGVTNGLTVIDRPTDLTLAQVFDLQARAKTDPAAQAELDGLNAAGRIGADRVFIGSRDRSASLDLKDALGRTRLRLVVDAAGEASIEFVSETGEVVKRVGVE